MHVPGHNPYITPIDPFSFEWYGAGAGDDGSFNIPGYQYSGISPTIMSALSNVLGGGYEGTQFDISEIPGIDLGDFETYTGQSVDDVHMVWGPEGIELHMSQPGEGSFSSEFGGDMGGTHWFRHGDSYDPSQGILPFIDVFDPESLALGLSSATGYDKSISPAELKALTPEMIEKTTGAYYSPYEESERAELVERKGKALGGASTGGFAGSAGRQSGLSGAERLYQGGYGDLLADIEKMKGQATSDVMDTIYGWQELMSNVG
jgi:hypothetical protein